MSSKKNYFNDQSSDLSPIALSEDELLKSSDTIDVMMSKINKVFRMLKSEAMQRPFSADEQSFTVSSIDVDELIQRGVELEQFNSNEAYFHFRDAAIEDISNGRISYGYKFKGLVSASGGGHPASSLSDTKVVSASANRQAGKLVVSVRFNTATDVDRARKQLFIRFDFKITNDPNLTKVR